MKELIHFCYMRKKSLWIHLFSTSKVTLIILRFIFWASAGYIFVNELQSINMQWYYLKMPDRSWREVMVGGICFYHCFIKTIRAYRMDAQDHWYFFPTPQEPELKNLITRFQKSICIPGMIFKSVADVFESYSNSIFKKSNLVSLITD